MSSAEVAKLEMQLRQTKNALEDTRAELDRVKLSSSGSEKDKAALQQQLNNELAQLKCEKNMDFLNTILIRRAMCRQQNREQQHKISEISDQLNNEQEAHKRTNAAMTQLRDGLKSEMDKIQSQQAQGEDAKVAFISPFATAHTAWQKSVESRLQSTGQELATVRAELQSEKAAHQTTAAQLATAHKDIVRAQLQRSLRVTLGRNRSKTRLTPTAPTRPTSWTRRRSCGCTCAVAPSLRHLQQIR